MLSSGATHVVVGSHPVTSCVRGQKLIHALRPLRTVTIDVNDHQLTAAPAIDADTQKILNSIAAESPH